MTERKTLLMAMMTQPCWKLAACSLKANEFHVDIAINKDDFQSCVDRSEPPYALWILCHTVPEDEGRDAGVKNKYSHLSAE
jgi:hypothetical protein